MGRPRVMFILLASSAYVVADAMTAEKIMDLEWKHFQVNHGKVYRTATEEKYRRKIFIENSFIIAQQNLKYSMGQSSFKMAMNKFGDLLPHELPGFGNRYHGRPLISRGLPLEIKTVGDIPAAFDWRDKGVVTVVKDQKHCGSCWAFSAVGALESQLFIHNKTNSDAPVRLSEQNLVDCDDSNGGCEGGFMDKAYDFIKTNGGIDTEESYTYTGNKDDCSYKPENSGGSVEGYVVVPSGDEMALTAAIFEMGPIAVAIDANHTSFQLYKEGVIDEPDCSTTILGHAALAVGFGTTDDGVDFYIVKNSWGEGWGENGYMRMRRNNDNQCGIATSALYPQV